MTPFEWLALVYFAAIAAIGGHAPRRRGLIYSAAAIALLIVARFLMPWDVRAWLAHVYLVLGYWIPAAFTPSPANRRFEDWLRRADARLGVDRWTSGHALELAYLLCYPLVPAAFSVMYVRGTADDVTRFWTSVLLAGFACYGTLRWTAARPPRLAAPPAAARRGVAALNAHVLGRVSHNQNTFPSGHVAVSIAAALNVAALDAAAGALFLSLAGAIAVATIAGRYHYAVDVLAGLLVGFAAWSVG